MAAKAPITINDGQATPVAVTFGVDSTQNGTYQFSDKTAGVSLGFRRLAVSTKLASGTSAVNRAKFTVELPVTQTVNGITSVAFTLRANTEVILPAAATDQNRKDLFAFLYNGLNHSLIKGAVRDLDPIY
ncbi:MAG: hypothetical protein [Sanya fiers-like virus 24]|nr:MAG: hypothetical protein [Sanya fiers-like virus 24]